MKGSTLGKVTNHARRYGSPTILVNGKDITVGELNDHSISGRDAKTLTAISSKTDHFA